MFFTIVHVEVLVKLTMMLTKGRKNKQEVVNVPARPWCYILHIADNQNRTTCAMCKKCKKCINKNGAAPDRTERDRHKTVQAQEYNRNLQKTLYCAKSHMLYEGLCVREREE